MSPRQGMRDQRQQLLGARLRRRARQAELERSDSTSWSPMVITGLSEVIGSWNTMAISRPRTARMSRSLRPPRSRPSKCTVPAVTSRRIGQEPHQRQRRHALAAAEFADDAQRLARLDDEANAADGLERAAPRIEATVRSCTDRSGRTAIFGCPSKNCTTASKGHAPPHHFPLLRAARGGWVRGLRTGDFRHGPIRMLPIPAS